MDLDEPRSGVGDTEFGTEGAADLSLTSGLAGAMIKLELALKAVP